MKKEFEPMDAAKIFDVPPWVLGISPRPRLARLRWQLRRLIPRGVWR